jgi:hypothetical protein
MMRTSAILTGLHVLVAFTPLYYVVVVDMIGAPAEIVEPSRLGLMIMVPWTWAVAYRRFNQGVLIRFGHSRAVGLGTLVRLGTDGLMLTTGYLIGTIPGIAVAASTLIAGVVSEAIYAGLRIRPVLREQLTQAGATGEPLTFRTFTAFYAPLAMTSALRLLVQPVGSAALSRMPDALDSLAAWSIVTGFVFLLRSLGFAYNEVVIALLDEPRAARNLSRFAVILAVITTVLLLTIAGTPLSAFWFGQVSGHNRPQPPHPRRHRGDGDLRRDHLRDPVGRRGLGTDDGAVRRPGGLRVRGPSTDDMAVATQPPRAAGDEDPRRCREVPSTA